MGHILGAPHASPYLTGQDCRRCCSLKSFHRSHFVNNFLILGLWNLFGCAPSDMPATCCLADIYCKRDKHFSHGSWCQWCLHSIHSEWTLHIRKHIALWALKIGLASFMMQGKGAPCTCDCAVCASTIWRLKSSTRRGRFASSQHLSHAPLSSLLLGLLIEEWWS